MRKYSVIFLIGFFSLIAQTLLFREFFQIFEGNELGLSAFFSSWLFWVAAGAWLGKKIKWFFSFESMPLLFLPAYLLQYMAILYSRTWSGISFYEVFPCEKMAMISFLVNSPVSLVTGFLFTQACRDQYGRVISVAKIYLLEAIGSFTGGMLVTLALSLTFSSEQIFLAALFLLMAPIALLQREQKKYLISGLYPLLILLFLFSVAPEKLSRCHDLYFWNNILPGGHFQGRFTTKKTRYLYGEYHDQFQVLSWGKVCETLPNTQHASEITALTLSQKSNAEKVLILGESILGIGLTMAKLPSVREITLLHDDEEYFPALFKIWPSSYRESLKKIKIPGQDIRQFLSSHPDSYDLILVHFPPAPSAVINRYYTEEFNHLLKQALKKDGVAAIQFSGGENFLGEELIRIGSSLYLTLKSCFLNIILKPGEESWFIASDWKEISSSASILSERFRSIDKSGRILSPERVLSLYPRDRIDFQMKLYRDYLNNNPVLKNTDTLPHLYLFRLLVYGKQTGVLFNRLLTSLTNKGLFPFLVLILIYGIFRLIYLIKGRSQKQTAGVFDSYFLVFSTGFISLSLELILMFIYQTRFGSIFLHIGLISSVFMLGLYSGGSLVHHVLSKRKISVRPVLFLNLLMNICVIGMIHEWGLTMSPLMFVCLFFGSGASTGGYFPAASHLLEEAELPSSISGSNLEASDHLGGAWGGLLTGLVLLPASGVQASLIVLSCLTLANFPVLLPPSFLKAGQTTGDFFDRNIRKWGYLLFGTAACFLILSRHSQPSPQGPTTAQVLTNQVLSFMEETGYEKIEVSPSFYYFRSENKNRYIFSTQPLDTGIEGYGGPIHLAVKTSSSGELIDFKILRSNETSGYLDQLEKWKKNLLGKNIFNDTAFHGVDGISGATITSCAILNILQEAGKKMAKCLLKNTKAESAPAMQKQIDKSLFLFLFYFFLIVYLRRYPSPFLRIPVLFLTLFIWGFLLDFQYSLDHVLWLFSLDFNEFGLNRLMILSLGIPALVGLFGNVYCGSLCPFGALNELIGEIRPRSWKILDPGKNIWRWARSMKYLILFLIAIHFSLTHNRAMTSADPLTVFFIRITSFSIPMLWWLALLLSFFYRRFWCRNICPSGAFLAIFNGFHIFKKLIPPTFPGKCDLGVRNSNELDCICCDRCRYEKK